MIEATAEVTKCREQAISSADRLHQLEHDLQQSKKKQTADNRELMIVKEQLRHALAERDALLATMTVQALPVSVPQPAQGVEETGVRLSSELVMAQIEIETLKQRLQEQELEVGCNQYEQ